VHVTLFFFFFFCTSKSNQNSGGVFDETPLHCACAKGVLPLVQLLKENGARLNTRCERNNTPLHEAVFGNHKKVRFNAFMWGCSTTNYGQVVEWLVDHGAKVFVKNQDRRTPEGMARSMRHMDLAHFLKKIMDAKKEALEQSPSPKKAAPVGYL